MSTRLADLFPQPKMLTLGGVRWLVSQYRLKDIGTMEAWVEARCPDPIATIDSFEPGTPECRKALIAALEIADQGLPGFDTPIASALLATAEGKAFCLWLSIHRAHPDFSLLTADELAAAMSEEDWTAFDRVAWALDVYDIVDSAINAECGISLPSRPSEDKNVTWTEAWLSTRMSIERFGNLYLSQWRAITNGGGKPDRGVPYPAGWTDEQFEAEYLSKRAAFFAEENVNQESSGDS